MALDIREGDILVIGSTEYDIAAAYNYDATSFLSGGAFGMAASTTCSTKRRPAMSSGKQGVPAANLSNLYCTPLDPFTPAPNQAPVTNAPGRLLQTFIQSGADMARLVIREARA